MVVNCHVDARNQSQIPCVTHFFQALISYLATAMVAIKRLASLSPSLIPFSFSGLPLWPLLSFPPSLHEFMERRGKGQERPEREARERERDQRGRKGGQSFYSNHGCCQVTYQCLEEMCNTGDLGLVPSIYMAVHNHPKLQFQGIQHCLIISTWNQSYS